jgi:hypothetical protein
MKKNKRGDLTWSTLVPWMIAIAVLVLTVVLYIALKGKGGGALEYLKNLFRFGR